jgi:hypothetical protein
MADQVELSFDAGSIERVGDQVTRRYLTAGADAVRNTTKWLERRLEAVTQEAVPGRLWRAIGSKAFPRSGPAQDPVGTIFLNGGDRTRGAFAFWSQPGEIRGSNGQYLAIPLPTAGSRGRTRMLTPGEWERANGVRLHFLYRQGKPSLLVAIGTTNGRSGAFRPLTATRSARGRGGGNPQADSVIPIFVLLPAVRFRNAVALQPIIDSADQELVAEFLRLAGSN